MFICQIYFYLIRANFAALGRTETAATCKLVNFENKKFPVLIALEKVGSIGDTFASFRHLPYYCCLNLFCVVCTTYG